MPNLSLREVVEDDLPHLYEHQRDPAACRMAAVPSRDWPVFRTHWREKVLGQPTARNRVAVVDGAVVGYLVAWDQDGQRYLGYWFDRSWWGRGLATEALGRFLEEEQTRPLEAQVAVHNLGSIRVLEKQGFQRLEATVTEGDGVELYRYRLDRPA